MDEEAVDGLLGVVDVDLPGRGREPAAIAHLAAALGVERGLLGDDLDLVSRPRAVGRLTADEIARTLVLLGTDASVAMNGHNTIADNGFSAAIATAQVDFSGLG